MSLFEIKVYVINIKITQINMAITYTSILYINMHMYFNNIYLLYFHSTKIHKHDFKRYLRGQIFSLVAIATRISCSVKTMMFITSFLQYPHVYVGHFSR